MAPFLRSRVMVARDGDGGERVRTVRSTAPAGTSSIPAPRHGRAAATPIDSRRPATIPIPQLTGLRWVAAVWVVLHHMSFLPVTGYAPWFAPIAPVVAAGPLGVDLFFALSGFLLARSYLDRWQGAPDARQVVSFVWARVCRVWPLYAVVVVVFGLWCALRAVLGSDGVITWQHLQPGLGAESWLRQLTMTQMWGSEGLDGVSFVLPTWSISAEWLAYLAFPVLAVGAWLLRGWPRPVLGALAVLAAAPVTVVAVVGHFEGFWFVRVAAGFTAGVLTWLVVRRVPRTEAVSRLAHRVLLVALAEIVLVVYWAATAPPNASFSADARVFLAVPLVPVVLGALALTDRGLARVLGSERMQYGGKVSYALYLVHFPLIEMALVAMTRVPALAPQSAGAALLVPHVLVASVLLAVAAYRWVEEPARVWMQRRDPSRRVGSARRDDREARRPEVTTPSRRRGVGRRGGSHAARPAPTPLQHPGRLPVAS